MSTSAKPILKLQFLQEPPPDVEGLCTELTHSRWPAGGWECGRATELVCASCEEPVCIRHSDTCLEGCILHTRCRENHAKQTGHSLEIPSHA